MKKIFLVSIIFLSVCNFSIAQDCKQPSEIKPWDYNSSKAIVQNKDWKNDVETYYWLLPLSWSKSHCDKFEGNISKKNKHQCLNNKFGFIVHGLWAQSKKTV